MKAGVDYTIVVPSRRRAHNMPVLRSLLPTALICIDERESVEYGAYVPEENLLLHPPMEGLPTITNWMLHEVKTPIFIRIDDDLRRVTVTAGKPRSTTDPNKILAIIENAAIACRDLDLGVFCFARTPNPMTIKPNERPIVPVQPVCNAFGVMNGARHRPWDPDLHGRADVDFTLTTLLEDRCVYCDVRFYFDFGPIGYGAGGSAGMISKEQYERVTGQLSEKWGKAIRFKGKGGNAKRGGSKSPMSIRVSRSNTRAQK